MRVFKRGKVYHCYVYEDGKRVSYSTRCHDKAAAEAVAKDLERRAADPAYAATLQETIDGAIRRLIENRSEKAMYAWRGVAPRNSGSGTSFCASKKS